MSIIKKEDKKPWNKYYINMKKNIEIQNASMYSQIKKTADKYPLNIAYSYYGNNVNYKTFIKNIDTSASSFFRLGIKKKDIVTIISPNTPEAITCFYAINKLSAIANMIHPLSAIEEIKYSLKESNSKYIVAIDMIYEKIKPILDELDIKKVIIIKVSSSMDPITKLGYFITKGIKTKKIIGNKVMSYERFIYQSKWNKIKIKDEGKKDNVAAILHSGGTTGIPKEVLLTNENFNFIVLSEIEMNKVLGEGTTILAIMPIFHGFGLGSTFHACFTSGATAIILPQVNPKKFDEVLLKYKPNVIACVPSILESICSSKKLAKEELTFIKSIVCGGDALTPSLNEKIDNFLFDHGSDAKVKTAYGMTECTAGVTMMPYEYTKKESIGIPCPGFDIKIKDFSTSKENEYGKVGEICVSGPSVMLGYLNNEEETSKVLRPDEKGKIWLHTGDLGYMDEEGFIYFSARAKRLIVSSGYNIFPSQIESVLNNHPYIKTSVVIGVPHPYKKEVPKAYIVLKENIKLSSEVKKSIKEHVEQNVAKYALPYSYGYRKELPKTIIGKIAYKELMSDDNEEE